MNAPPIFHSRFQSLSSEGSRGSSNVLARRLPANEWIKAADTAAFTVDFLARDGAQLFRQRFAFLPLINHECVVFAMSRPWAMRHFAEFYKLPVGHIRFLQSKVIAHRRRNIETGAFIQIGFGALIAEHVLPVIGAEWTGIFPLGINRPIAFANGDPSIFASRNAGALVRFSKPGNNAWCLRSMTCARLIVVRQRAVEWILLRCEFRRNVIASMRGIRIVKAAVVFCPLFVP